jgi:dipeptidyl aminopeptidase/acylaminoacyl peptidase
MLLVFGMGYGAAFAQTANAPAPEGKLDKFINLDAQDTTTKLEILQHELDAQEQKIILLQFLQTSGERIRLREVRYPSTGDSLIPAYIFTPKRSSDSDRHPAIVMVHGGFHERFNVEWFPLIEMAIEKGYAVIFPEYRGSKGYGANHFRNEYGITDVADVLSAADYIARQKFVDAQSVSIVGESRGGMATLLAIEKAPKRFKAAVDVVGLTDFVAYMAYKPEYRRQEVAKESAFFAGKLPDENLAAYMDVSPINHVDAIETPLLILATTGDKIAPLTLHTGRLVDALKARGKKFEAKIYDHAPGGHVFLHGDSPEKWDAYDRIFAWLDQYAK